MGTSYSDNDLTESVTKIIEAAEKLGWKVAFMVDEEQNITSVFAGSAEEVLQLKAMIQFEHIDDRGGSTH